MTKTAAQMNAEKKKPRKAQKITCAALGTMVSIGMMCVVLKFIRYIQCNYICCNVI